MRPIRILHVYGRMGRGGAETWIMNVLRRIDRQQFQFDFMVHKREPGELDEEIRSLGSNIHIVPSYRNPARYPVDLGTLLRRERYDIVHSHVSFSSGYILALARLFGVRGRIAHSHTSVPAEYDAAAWRKAYKQAMRMSLHVNATCGVGCSSKAVAALFGHDWQARPKYRVLFYGYDFERFAGGSAEERAAYRSKLGIGEGEYVIGHIGRFVTPKNHEFMLDIAAASKARGRDRERFVLVGGGELEPGIRQAAAARGLDGKIVFTGARSDIPELLRSFDVLILPSLWEGLPVTILEAQAAGVPCIMSDRVTSEAIVLNGDVVQRPLGDVDAWLAAVDAMRARPALNPAAALQRMQGSPFAIDRHMAQLERIYEAEAGR